MGVYGLYEMYIIELLILIFVLSSRVILKKHDANDSTVLIEEAKSIVVIEASAS